MATDKDRPNPLKQPQRDASGSKAEHDRPRGAEVNRGVDLNRPPVWSNEADRFSQEQSAMDMIKYHNAQRTKAREEPARNGPDAPAPDRANRARFAALKAEQAKAVGNEQETDEKKKEAKPKLTFFKDRHPEHDKDRGHGH